jgi:hypothetical protein
LAIIGIAGLIRRDPVPASPIGQISENPASIRKTSILKARLEIALFSPFCVDIAGYIRMDGKFLVFSRIGAMR